VLAVKNLTKPQRVLYFDGADDRVTTGVTPDWNKDFSMSGWFIRSGAGTGVATWFSTYAGTAAQQIHFYINSGNINIGFRGGGASGTWFSVSTVGLGLADGTWYHFVLTHKKSTAVVKVYVNGSEVATATGNTSHVTYGGAIVLGRNGSLNEHYLKGYQDFFQLWEVELSSSDALALSKSKTISTTPVLQYKFNEKSGTTAYDSIASRDATLVGATRQIIRRRQ
jgi:hypothetical protein